MAEFPSPQGMTTPTGQVSSTAALVAYLLLGLAALTQIAGSGLATPAPLLTIIGIAAAGAPRVIDPAAKSSSHVPIPIPNPTAAADTP